MDTTTEEPNPKPAEKCCFTGTLKTENEDSGHAGDKKTKKTLTLRPGGPGGPGSPVAPGDP